MNWNKVEFNTGTVEEQTKVDFAFDYLGGKIIKDARGTCGCIAKLAPVSIDGKQSVTGVITTPYANHFEPDLLVPFEKTVTVTFEDNSRETLKIVGNVIKTGHTKEVALKDAQERQRVSSQPAPTTKRSPGGITIEISK